MSSKKKWMMPPMRAFETIAQFVDDAGIAGSTRTREQIVTDACSAINLSENPSMVFTWNRGWATETRIHLTLHKNSPPNVEVSWAMSRYEPSAARVAAQLHGQVADLALAIAHAFDELRVFRASQA